jgi:hypothetical protein
MLATEIEPHHVCFRYMLRTYVVQARGRNLGRAIAPIGRNDVAPRQHQLNVNLTTQNPHILLSYPFPDSVLPLFLPSAY